MTDDLITLLLRAADMGHAPVLLRKAVAHIRDLEQELRILRDYARPVDLQAAEQQEAEDAR